MHQKNTLENQVMNIEKIITIIIISLNNFEYCILSYIYYRLSNYKQYYMTIWFTKFFIKLQSLYALYNPKW